MRAIINFFNHLSKCFRKTDTVTVTASPATAPRLSATRIYGIPARPIEVTDGVSNLAPTEYGNQRTLSSNASIDSNFDEEGESSPPRQTRAKRKLLISAALELYADSRRTSQRSKIVALKHIYQEAILNYIHDIASFDSIEIRSTHISHEALSRHCPLGVSLYAQGLYLEFVVLKIQPHFRAECLTLPKFSGLINAMRAANITGKFRLPLTIREASHEEDEDEGNSFSPSGTDTLTLPGAVDSSTSTITDETAISFRTRTMS